MPPNTVPVASPLDLIKTPSFVGGLVARFLEQESDKVACRKAKQKIKQTPILLVMQCHGEHDEVKRILDWFGMEDKLGG